MPTKKCLTAPLPPLSYRATFVTNHNLNKGRNMTTFKIQRPALRCCGLLYARMHAGLSRVTCYIETKRPRNNKRKPGPANDGTKRRNIMTAAKPLFNQLVSRCVQLAPKTMASSGQLQTPVAVPMLSACGQATNESVSPQAGSKHCD